MILKTSPAQCAHYKDIFMPIKIISNELTATHKREVRKEFEKITISLEVGQPGNYKHIISAIEELGCSKNKLKRTLSNYLMAIYIYLGLPESQDAHLEVMTIFDFKYEKQLLATLLYFVNTDDVIPDHIAYIGYLDDAYCVNLALQGQNSSVKEELESIVKALEALEV